MSARPWLLVSLVAALTAAVVPLVLRAGGKLSGPLTGRGPVPMTSVAEPLARAIASGGDAAGIFSELQRNARKTGYLLEERADCYVLGRWPGVDWVVVGKASGEIVRAR